MIKNTIILMLVALSMTAYCQQEIAVPSSVADSLVQQQTEALVYAMQGKERYKLYPTENMYNFLKLDTQTGRIYQVQWNLDTEKEFTTVINGRDLSYDTGIGTFELYPTENMYQFLLLNKVNGAVWHVQWGLDSLKRWIRRIY